MARYAALKLLSTMRRMSTSVNDREVCRRFQGIINSHRGEGLSNSFVNYLINNKPSDMSEIEISNSYLPCINHYIYMCKRDAARKAKPDPGGVEPGLE